MNARNANLDMTRGAAILLVVLYHSLRWGHFDEVLPLYRAASGAFRALRMPVLFLISGVLANSLMRSGGDKIARRCTQFAWLFGIWTPINYLFNPEVGFRPIGVGMALEIVRPSTVLWFIWILAILTALIPLVRHAPRHLVALMTIVIASVSYALDFYVLYANILQLSCFFTVGLLYRDEIMRVLQGPISYKLMGMLFLAMVVTVGIGRWLEFQLGWPIIGTFERFSICAVALYGMGLLSGVPYLSTTLQWFGRNTLSIYVAHAPLIFFIREFVPDLGPASRAVAPLLIAAAAVTGALALHAIAVRCGGSWLYQRPAGLRSRAGLWVAQVPAIRHLLRHAQR